MSFCFSEIKGYAEALAAARAEQSQARESAWLNLPLRLGGVTVRQMTVADYVVLDNSRSPFLYRAAPTLDDLKIFLWVLSPACGAWLYSAGFKGWLLRQLPTAQAFHAFLYGQWLQWKIGRNIPESSEKTAVAAFSYIKRMFMDAPASTGGNGVSSACYIGSWFDAIQSEHPAVTTEELWQMPLPVLFQRIKAIQSRNVKLPAINTFVDELHNFVVRGIRTKQFTVDDLRAGRVKLPTSFQPELN